LSDLSNISVSCSWPKNFKLVHDGLFPAGTPGYSDLKLLAFFALDLNRIFLKKILLIFTGLRRKYPL